MYSHRSKRPTIKQHIRLAVACRDLETIAIIVDRARMWGINGVRFDYEGLASLFNRCAGIDRDQFEGLMQEVDEMEARA